MGILNKRKLLSLWHCLHHVITLKCPDLFIKREEDLFIKREESIHFRELLHYSLILSSCYVREKTNCYILIFLPWNNLYIPLAFYGWKHHQIVKILPSQPLLGPAAGKSDPQVLVSQTLTCRFSWIAQLMDRWKTVRLWVPRHCNCLSILISDEVLSLFNNELSVRPRSRVC